MTRCLGLLAFLACACGDDGGDGCPTPVDASPPPDGAPIDPLCAGEGCGGDVVGTWELVASCARGSGDGSFFNCPDGDVHYGDDFHVRGSWTIAEDGTVTSVVSEHLSARLVLPLSCYGLLDCAALESVGEASLEGLTAECVDVGPFDEQCEVIPETCDCAAVLDDDEVELEGTMTTDTGDGTFTFTLGDEAVDGEYCVDGDELWVGFIRFGGVAYQYRFERAPE